MKKADIVYGISIAIFTAMLIFLSVGSSPADVITKDLKKAKGYAEIPVRIEAVVKIPEWYHEGLFFDGKDIWVANGEKGKIWVVDTSSGSVKSELTPVSDFTEGITRGPDGSLYVTDWYEKLLYKVRFEDGNMAPESSVSFAPAYPAGVIWNGLNFFVITWTRGAFGTRFHLLKLGPDCRLIEKVKICIQEPAHLAWDGKNLWMTSWYDKKVYKIDVDNWKILGFFRSPVALATGIAWDGMSLWLTGTRSSLYKMDVKE